MTPKQLKIVYFARLEQKQADAKEYQVKFENQRNLIITQAWLTAKLSRAKKIPDIEKLIKKDIPLQKDMTSEQMLEKVKILNQLFGGEVR